MVFVCSSVSLDSLPLRELVVFIGKSKIRIRLKVMGHTLYNHLFLWAAAVRCKNPITLDASP